MSTSQSPAASSSSPSKIKVLLFDIGGVCVKSPMQAIRDYERAHNIPDNWFNFAISRSGTDGAWQRLERGEVTLNEEEFFDQFRRELHDEKVWREYWDVFVRKRDTTAVASSTSPADARSKSAPPRMDTTTIFWSMMAAARQPDPYMYPTLRYLRAKHPHLVLAALSNTVPFPPEHPYSHPISAEQDPRQWFDVFVSSCEVGLRKPARPIYELALSRVNAWAREKNGTSAEVAPGEVLFLDDIGENCKMGAVTGFQVIKVNLGRSRDAIRELGRRVLGVDDLVERVQEWERGRSSTGTSRL